MNKLERTHLSKTPIVSGKFGRGNHFYYKPASVKRVNSMLAQDARPSLQQENNCNNAIPIHESCPACIVGASGGNPYYDLRLGRRSSEPHPHVCVSEPCGCPRYQEYYHSKVQQAHGNYLIYELLKREDLGLKCAATLSTWILHAPVLSSCALDAIKCCFYEKS